MKSVAIVTMSDSNFFELLMELINSITSFKESQNIAICVLDYYKYEDPKAIMGYIDFPEGLEDQYQAFTEADMSLLKSKGYNESFMSLEKGVKSYLDWLSKNTRMIKRIKATTFDKLAIFGKSSIHSEGG